MSLRPASSSHRRLMAAIMAITAGVSLAAQPVIGCLEYFKRGAQGMYLFNDGGAYLGEFHHLERWGEFEDPLGFHVEPIKRE